MYFSFFNHHRNKEKKYKYLDEKLDKFKISVRQHNKIRTPKIERL